MDAEARYWTTLVLLTVGILLSVPLSSPIPLAAAYLGTIHTWRRWVFDRVAGEVRLELPLRPAHWIATTCFPLAEIRGFTLEGSFVSVITLHSERFAHELARVDARARVVESLAPLFDLMPPLTSATAPRPAPPAVVVQRRGECQVCGTDRLGRWVACEACETPHHADCWDYNYRCSTYGCGCKRSAPLEVRA